MNRNIECPTLCASIPPSTCIARRTQWQKSHALYLTSCGKCQIKLPEIASMVSDRPPGALRPPARPTVRKLRKPTKEDMLVKMKMIPKPKPATIVPEPKTKKSTTNKERICQSCNVVHHRTGLWCKPCENAQGDSRKLAAIRKRRRGAEIRPGRYANDGSVHSGGRGGYKKKGG